MLLYSHTITPRLKYITAFIGQQLEGKDIELTTDKNYFRLQQVPKINYSSETIGDLEFWIPSRWPLGSELLFEASIHEQRIICFEVNASLPEKQKYKAFFKTAGNFPFDIFAASFYLLSRYEEWLPHQKDIYGRYAHENCLAFKENFLHLPLINIWIENLKIKLKEKFPSFSIFHSPFSFIPTYDIDEAYSYRHKSWVRTAGAVIRSMVSGQWSRLNERIKVLRGKINDPFDAYAWMDQLHRQYNLKPHYFFLVAGTTGKYDKNIRPSRKAMQQLIQDQSSLYSIGIHPSWQSGDDPALLRYEILKLGHIGGKQILSSRQHYIRFDFPKTFRELIDAGIESDFSMGYGSINGFRASVAKPFYWYDLEKEEQTKLVLYPFCYMDANSFFEQNISPQKALEEMQYYYEVVKAVNGTLITIWHNTFLGTDKLFEGWREVYEQFIREVKSGS